MVAEDSRLSTPSVAWMTTGISRRLFDQDLLVPIWLSARRRLSAQRGERCPPCPLDARVVSGDLSCRVRSLFCVLIRGCGYGFHRELERRHGVSAGATNREARVAGVVGHACRGTIT